MTFMATASRLICVGGGGGGGAGTLALLKRSNLQTNQQRCV